MVRSLSLVLCFLLGSVTLGADNKEQGRLENCGVVMQEILDVPDNIPQELLEKAECVIRHSVDDEGGACDRRQLRSRGDGLSIGQNVQGALGRTRDVFARGRELRLAARRGIDGRRPPRHEGTSLRPDDDASEQVYGRKVTARNIVTGKRITVPASGRLVAVLEKNAPRNESTRSTKR
jgi:hypothetical protein